MQQIVTSSGDQTEQPPLSREERLKQITARYEKFESIIKSGMYLLKLTKIGV